MAIIDQADIKTVLGISSPTSEEQAILTLVQPAAEAAVKAWLGYDPEQKAATEFYPFYDLTTDIDQAAVWDVTATRAILKRTSAGDRTLQLRRLPLRSVDSLYVDHNAKFGKQTGSFAADTQWTEGVDFWGEYEQDGLCMSGMLFANGTWPSEPGTVKVTYTAGYASAEFNGTGSVDAGGIKRAIMLTSSTAFVTWMQSKKSPISGFTGPIEEEQMRDYRYKKTGASGSASASLTDYTIAVPPEAERELQSYRHWGLMRT